MKRVTILDVAAGADVSIASVSAALNKQPGVSDETRSRIIDVANRLGWVPSVRGRSLSGKRAFAVGLVIERPPEVIESDPFFAGFIAGIESILAEHGFALVLQIAANRRSSIDRHRQLMLDHRVDGVFVTDLSARDARIDLVRDLGLPAVAVNSDPGCPVPSVRQDYRPGLVDLVHQVVWLGHHNVAHVAGQRGMVHTRQRLKVWRTELDRAGHAPGEVVYGDFSAESGSRAADRLLADPAVAPTAVVCANDLMAIGFVARAAALGWDVPGEISVTGFDGVHLGAHVRPPLTTVQTAPRQLGSAAGKLMMRAVTGEDVEDVDIEPTALLMRDSLARPRPRRRRDPARRSRTGR